MLIIGSQRLNKAHRRQMFVFQILEEIVFILQMGRGHRISDSIFPRGVVVIVSKRLMMPLEQRINGRV
jgi:hypothetical protein